MWGGEWGWVRGAGGVGCRFSGVGKGLFEKFAAYVRRARWEGWLSLGEHEREDLGVRSLREGFLFLYNRSLLPDPKDMLELGKLGLLRNILQFCKIRKRTSSICADGHI
jgi:hypothetical protein